MLHYLNEYLTKEDGPTTADGASLGGDPKTGAGSWADEMGQVLKEAVKVRRWLMPALSSIDSSAPRGVPPPDLATGPRWTTGRPREP